MTEQRTQNRIETSELELAPGGLVVNSGSKTFLVGLHFSKTCKDTLEDKVKKLIKKNVESGSF